MDITHLAILCSLPDQPLEDGLSFAEAFGMPLYAHDALMLSTFYSLNDAISRACCYTEPLTGIPYSLMVERVNIDMLLPIQT